MKNVVLGFSLLLALASSAFAATHNVPDENPVATVTAPDGWKAEDHDKGVELTSDDGEVYIAVEATGAKGVEKSMDEAMTYLKKKGVTVDEKSMKQSESKVGGKDAVLVSWNGKDEEGEAHIQLMIVSVSDDKGVLLLYWASPEGEKKHQDDITAIAQSLKKA
jgi:opacity protein-like surface antigen